MPLYYTRELTGYPTGRRRIWLLAMAVLASLIANYEVQIASVVPLLLVDLKMSLTTYGLIGATSVGVGAISAALGGWLSDRYGRMVVLIPTLGLTALTNYLMVIVETPGELLFVRCLMQFIEGASITLSVGLVRDFSPRMGRATAFGFWNWGPIGAAFLGTGIAGLTLPIFGTWESQFIIMGTISLAATLLISTQLADLSPALRAATIKSDDQMSALPDGGAGAGTTTGTAVKTGAKTTATTSAGTARLATLFGHPHLWVHIVTSALWLSVYYTLVAYGPTLLNQAFGIPVETAALIGSGTALANGMMVILSGWLSDRLQLRRPFALVGTLLSTGALLTYIPFMDAQPSTAQVATACVLLGAFLGVSFAPWMANFSENAEDIAASLQGTAFGVWGATIRFMIVALLIFAPVVAQSSSWATWVAIIAVAHAIFIPAVFVFKGPMWSAPRATASAAANEG
jgi:MFS family permease